MFTNDRIYPWCSSKQMSTFQGMISFFFFFWITGVLCNIKSKTKIDFKSSLIHYLVHVWLLDPVSLRTNSSVCPFTPPSSDRQPFLFNWVSKESSEVQNQSFKEVSAMFFLSSSSSSYFHCCSAGSRRSW